MGDRSEPRAWIGREEWQSGPIGPAPAQGFAALLDRDPDALAENTPLPVGWHWFYLHRAVRRSEWGEDGHPRRGEFLPPVSLSRRMWAGGRLRFAEPLRIGEAAERRSEIVAIEPKRGRTGPLVLVTVRHRITGPRGLAVEEEQDLIYREPAGAERTPPPAPEGGAWSERFLPDSVVLFRFSALTDNGHRIHYDRPYTTEREGYPRLLVHGPLTALLLLEAAQRHAGRRARRFEYRAVAPVYADESITLAGRPVDAGADAWATGPRGLAMRATLEWAS